MLRRVFGRRTCPRVVQRAPWHHTKSRALAAALFPVASNEPLAGTIDGSSPPFLFIFGCVIGLPVTLWTYKCLMMVAFQRSIIYVPSMPPFTKKLGTEHYKAELGSAGWREGILESPSKSQLRGLEFDPARQGGTDVVVVYLQGNAGTIPLRIAKLKKLASLGTRVVAFSPRGYWLSSRVWIKQTTLLEDHRAAVRWAKEHYPTAKLVLYGHSIGAAAAAIISDPDTAEGRMLDGVVLDCAMPPLPDMVKSMFPQRWLPYHYLSPLAFDRWDSVGSLAARERRVPLLSITSSKDELIAPEYRQTVHDAWRGSKRLVTVDALHDTAYTTKRWLDAWRAFLTELTVGE